MTKTIIAAIMAASSFLAPSMPASAHEAFGGDVPHCNCNGRVQFSADIPVLVLNRERRL